MKKKITQINEAARKNLGITRDEYALCSYVQYRQADRRGRSGWCVDAKQEIADFVGITRPGLYKMLSRLEGENLLFIEPKTGAIQVTEHWLDSENERKQSLHSGVNKVYSECKQSLQPGVNKVTHILKEEKEEKKEKGEVRENAPAPEKENEPSTLEAETLRSEEGSAGAAPARPSLKDCPNADTPRELADAMRKFYKAYPREWKDGVLEAGGKIYPEAQQVEIANAFFEWAITEGWGGRNYGQLNARLQKWFRDQKTMRRAEPQNAGPSYPVWKEGATTVYTRPKNLITE